MFCRNCGKEIDPGLRFCVFCGAEQQAADPGPEGGAPPGKKRGLSTAGIIVIAVVAVLVAAGAGVGIYFLVRGDSSGNKDNGRTTPTTIPGTTGTTVQGEKLAYINGGDIYTVNLDGTDQRKITSRGDIVDFATAPDGSRIAFVAAPGDQKVIFKMSPDGSDVSQVTLPEKGQAENPVFDPTGKYIFFTRVTPQQQANIEAAEPYGVDFERYNISANNVDHIYTYGGLQEQSILGLSADPSGETLYFNLYGSDWPSSVPYKLTLGPAAAASVYMPMQRDTGEYAAVAFQLTGFSKTGAYVSYFKSTLMAEPSQQSGPSQEESACYKRVSSDDETVAASYVLGVTTNGNISGMEFSRVSNTTYYFAKIQSAGETAPSVTLEFYKGAVDGSPSPAGLDVVIAQDTEQYEPLVWHLLAVER